MADTLDVLTLAEAKQAVDIPTGDTSQDAEIEVYVTAVSRALDDLCGPIVARTNTSELHTGDCYTIRPRQTPVLTITSITEYSDTTATTLSAESNASKPANGYLLDSKSTHNVVIRRRSLGGDSWFAYGRNNIDVAYRPGRYATTATVDAKFKQAAAIMLRQLWASEQGVSSETFGALDQVTPLPPIPVPRAVRQLLAAELRPIPVA